MKIRFHERVTQKETVNKSSKPLCGGQAAHSGAHCGFSFTPPLGSLSLPLSFSTNIAAIIIFISMSSSFNHHHYLHHHHHSNSAIRTNHTTNAFSSPLGVGGGGDVRMSQLLEEDDHKRCSLGNRRNLLDSKLENLRGIIIAEIQADDWKYETKKTTIATTRDKWCH